MLIAKHVKDILVSEIKESQYFSISVDSTPDVSHTDQLSFCIRYVKNGSPVERFLEFIQITDHISQSLANTVEQFLTDNIIDIMNCRGQSYDNANNMAGPYGGLQAKISDINPLAIFIPCAAHSLNLVGRNAISKDKRATDFFQLVESLYHHFVYSEYRWNQLKSQLTDKGEFTLKRATGTRWSAKHDAIRSLHSCYVKVVNVLESLSSESSTQTNENKVIARGFINQLCRFSNILMLVIWKRILSEFNRVNIILQKSDMDLSVSVKLYKSLISFLEDLKKEFNSIFNEAIKLFNEVKNKCQYEGIQTRAENENAQNPEHQKQQLLESVFSPIVNALVTNLNQRCSVYSRLNENFSFLTNLKHMNNDEISTACSKIASIYSNDIDESELLGECQFAKSYFFSDESKQSHKSMYKTIIDEELLSVFPNIEIILRIYLCLFVTNVSDERSFSKLKYIKNYLRNSMSENKLNALALFSIETEVLDSLNFDDIIESFVHAKCRKKAI